jgi:hypothetical protein
MLPSISPPPRVGAPHSRQSKGTGGRGDRARSLAEDERDELTYFLTTGCDVDEETLQVALRLLGDDTTVHVLVEEPRLVDRVVLSPASAASVASLAALPVQDVFAVSGGNIFVSASFLPALVASLEEGEPPQLRDFILTTPGVVSRAQPLAGLTVGVCAEVNWCSQALLRDVVLAAGARSIDEASSSHAFDVLLSDAPRRGARVLDCQALKLAVLTGRLPPSLPLLELSSVAPAARSSSSVVRLPALDSERTTDVASPEEVAPAEDDETVADDGGQGGQLGDSPCGYQNEFVKNLLEACLISTQVTRRRRPTRSRYSPTSSSRRPTSSRRAQTEVERPPRCRLVLSTSSADIATMQSPMEPIASSS